MEHFIRGYDSEVRNHVITTVTDHLGKYSDEVNTAIVNLTNGILEKLGSTMPSGVEVKIPDVKDIPLNLEQFRTDLDYANIPLQEAVNFVAFLVNLQSGKARFARGVATVGGRTHIGVITKDRGFRLIEEPDLKHRDTGFGDDQ